MNTHDVHCHFFSPRFFEVLAEQKKAVSDEPVAAIAELLGWDPPRSVEQMADRWVRELDRYDVGRAAIMASVPGDQDSVAQAVAQHPKRFVGFFMLDPTQKDAVELTRRALGSLGLRCVCLFPAMHHYRVYDAGVLKVFEVAAEAGATVFVHCGVLSVGVRKKLGLPSRFDMRCGNPVDLHSVALSFPDLPIIIPHFGAGLFREALMVADLCPNVHLDTSSSNSWIKFHPGLTLDAAFSQALAVVGPNRLLFGTDSSFFPRGWQSHIFKDQREILERLGVGEPDRRKIFVENFERLFPAF
jgi:predicted TIM-barrel fold metal-dependent hydrolase